MAGRSRRVRKAAVELPGHSPTAPEAALGTVLGPCGSPTEIREMTAAMLRQDKPYLPQFKKTDLQKLR